MVVGHIGVLGKHALKLVVMGNSTVGDFATILNQSTEEMAVLV